MMMKVMVDDYVLKMLWEAFPNGAAKAALSEEEMRGHIRRWRYDEKLRQQKNEKPSAEDRDDGYA